MEDQAEAKRSEVVAQMKALRRKLEAGDDSQLAAWVIPGALACAHRPLRHHPLYGGSGLPIPGEARPLILTVVCRYCGRQLNVDTLGPSAPLPTASGSAPNLSHFPTYYQDEFRQIYESKEQYTGKWNWAAFLFGTIWALTKGLWGAAVVSLVAGFATGGLGFLVYWVIFGARGNYIYYSSAVKGRQRVF